MARLNVNPTRMEMKKLKSRLLTATRGHKLLKDKSDEMIRQFSVLIKRNKALRDEVEKELNSVLKEFAMARSMLSRVQLEKVFSMPSVNLQIECGTKNIMSVEVPALTVQAVESQEKYPYSFAEVTSEADYSVQKISKVIEKLVQLAEVEKAVSMLALEIERNKRRVNALEYVMIPQLNETIKYIANKLDENERSANARLMKVKGMIEERKSAN